MTDKTRYILLFALTMLFPGCSHEHPDETGNGTQIAYQYLPENLIAYNDAKTISARYVDPTLRYDHGVLGDKTEAGGLLVVKNNREYYYRLDTNFVFEDLRPRLKDLDNDGEPEYITIQTSLQSGASVAVYRITNDKLVLFARSDFIGTPYRWLNIAAIDDLDNDGRIEFAWVQTPHIGGVLKIGRIQGDSLMVLDEKAGVSNHEIGSRNLCLSAVTIPGNQKILYVPDNPHGAVVGFLFQDNLLTANDTILLNVDPSIPLFMQYSFPGILGDENCIYVLN